MLATGDILPRVIRPHFPTYLKYFVCQSLLALAAMAGALWWLASRRAHSGPPARPALPAFPLVLGAYAVWGALSYLWSPWRYGTLGYVVRELWLFALCIGFFWVFARSRRWLAFAGV